MNVRASSATQVADAPATPSIDAPSTDAPVADAPAPGETRYLAFQIFEGTADPSIPFDTVVDYTPAAKIAATVDDIVAKVGARGDHTRLAVILGPISFDHSDAEARQIIADGFAIARARRVAVGFHIDDSMFWSKRADLTADPASVEWTDWNALANRGFSAANPPADVGSEIASIVGELILYTHVAFLVTTGRPGFTTYPGDGVLDQIHDERATHGSPAWASAQGTNLIPGDAVGTTGLSMAAYLARCFDHDTLP